MYTVETNRPLGTRLKEHNYNLRLGHGEKSKLAACAIEEGHRIVCDTTHIVQIEPNSNYRKYREAARMLHTHNPISQPNVDIPFIWFPVIKK
jgi:hypothetical protein